MTFGEVETVIINYDKLDKEKHKEQLIYDYNLADMISSFVLLKFDNKPIPKLYECFPDLFQDQKKKEEEDMKRIMLYKEQMIDFANYHNKKRKGVKK